MASQSPSDQQVGDSSLDYFRGWAAISTMLENGSSWSGRERNVCYLNLGEGRFADASWVAGLDFPDDGRALAMVDWDSDGDLDLWAKNRTGPQLRFLRNEGYSESRKFTFQLQGVKSNRDAVGARVELRSGSQKRIRWVVAGDGYLSQSTRRIRFALEDSGAIDSLVVRWPGGASEKFDGVSDPGGYRLVEGTGQARSVPTPPLRPMAAPIARGDADPRESRVLLRTPLALPPSISTLVGHSIEGGRGMLINIWAHWCEPCIDELGGLAESYVAIDAEGLDIVAVSIDDAEDRLRSEAVFGAIAAKMTGPGFESRPATEGFSETLDALLTEVLGTVGEWTLPTSLLVDREGRIQMLYLGPVGPDRLLSDRRAWIDQPPPGSLRTLTHGRWYFRVPRDLAGLAAELQSRERVEDANFYRALDRSGRRGAPKRPANVVESPDSSK